MSMRCRKRNRRFDANEGKVLFNLPDYTANLYPVDTTYAREDHESHLSRATIDVFSDLILTYGNGKMCSRMLYNAINRSYLGRVKSYYWKWKEKKAALANGTTKIKEYVPKDGLYVKTYPPLGTFY